MLLFRLCFFFGIFCNENRVSVPFLASYFYCENPASDEPSVFYVYVFGALLGFLASSAVVAGTHHFHLGFRHNISPSGDAGRQTFGFVYDDCKYYHS